MFCDFEVSLCVCVHCSGRICFVCVCAMFFVLLSLCHGVFVCVYVLFVCVCDMVMWFEPLGYHFFTNTSYYSFTNPSSRLQLAFSQPLHNMAFAMKFGELLQALSLCRL